MLLVIGGRQDQAGHIGEGAHEVRRHVELSPDHEIQCSGVEVVAVVGEDDYRPFARAILLDRLAELLHSLAVQLGKPRRHL